MIWQDWFIISLSLLLISYAFSFCDLKKKLKSEINKVYPSNRYFVYEVVLESVKKTDTGINNIWTCDFRVVTAKNDDEAIGKFINQVAKQRQCVQRLGVNCVLLGKIKHLS